MRPPIASLVRRSTRRTLLAAFLASVSPSAVFADYPAEVLSENPIVYYRFNDGVTTEDTPPPAANSGSLGAAGNGPYSDGVTKQATGALVGSTNKAIDVTANAVTAPYNAALNIQGSFSVEVWLKPTAIPAAAALICPIASWKENPADASGREGWLIYQGDAATGFNFRTYNKNGANIAASISSGTGVTAGAWHHVVATWDNTAAVARIYVNGVLKTTSPVVVPVAPATRAFEANTVNGFTLGSRSDNAFAWQGSIDEPAYYSGVLTDAQVLAHYNNGISPTPSQTYDSLIQAVVPPPVGYWRLNEAVFVPRTPPVAANAGTLGSAANGGYNFGAKNAATGGPSTASGFPGFGASNSSVSLANANGYVGTGQSLLNNRSSFTVMGWVKRGAVHSTRGGYFGQNDVLEFGDAGTGTQIEAYSGASGQLLTDPPYPFADDEWGFITYVADGTKVDLYLNGLPVKTNAATVTNYGSSAYFFNIGGGGVFAPTGDYFRGEIDEVAIFDKAVTAGRVKQLYDSAKGNVAVGLVDAVPKVTPLTGEVAEGQSYSLTIDPTGSPPFTYQWKENGVNIAGATSQTYTKAVAEAHSPPLDPFLYSVTVTNISGTASVTSEQAAVFVTPTLRWTSTDPTNPGKWDIAGPINWKTFTAGVAVAYDEDKAVVFDDTAAATTVDLVTDVTPREVILNNSTKTYTFTGAFLLSGPPGATLTKNGTGTAIFANDILNMDNVVVNSGILRVGNGITGTLTPISTVKVQGGELEVNQGTGTTYDSATVVSSGRISFVGAGDLSTTGAISGPGNELFNRTGTTVINGANTIGGTVTIASGTVAFDGSQPANRLPASGLVTVNAGATMEVRGVNALPTAANSVSVVLNQATLGMISGASLATGVGGQSHAHLKDLTLNGSSVLLVYSGDGSAYSGESFQLNGNITVTGSTASTIAFGNGAAVGNAGIAPSGLLTHTVTVANVASGPDLTINAEIENTDAAAADAAASTLVKAGPGTLRLAGAFAHSYSGTTRIDQGTLEATGSIVGPVTVSAGGTIAPGLGAVGSFATGAATLSGIYAADINGATADKITVSGNMVISPGAQVAITVLGGGVTAPVYELMSWTGTLTGSLPASTGVPVGYSLVLTSSSLALVQNGFNSQPVITKTTAPADGITDFNSNGGGFSVSAAVSAETDWTYSAGSWRSAGQSAALTDDNTSHLLSPIYTLTQAGSVTMSFIHRYSFEIGFDGGAVETSFNGGPFIHVPGTAFSQNPYNGTVPADVTHSLKGLEAFVGDSAGHPAFLTSIFTAATGVAGDTVQVRFTAAYDNNTAGDLTPPGWEIDSMQITGARPSLLSLAWPAGIMQYSDNLQPPWTDITGPSPALIDMKAAPKRFFRLKP